MTTKSQKIRLGAFILFSLIVLVLILSLIIGNQLVNKMDTYYIHYKDVSVSGLNVGGAVQYHGIRIGNVADMKIDPENVATIIVEINVQEDTPIKKDVKAILSSVGITGLKQIELKGGTPAEKNLEPGDIIPAGESTMSMITGKAEVISEKIERVLNNLAKMTDEENMKSVDSVITNTNRTLTNFNEIISNNKSSFSNSMNNIANISSELNLLLKEIRQKTAQIDMNKLNNTLTSTNDAVENIDQAVDNINYTFTESREDIVYSIQLLKETMQNLNEFSRLIAEDPSNIIRQRD